MRFTVAQFGLLSLIESILRKALVIYIPRTTQLPISISILKNSACLFGAIVLWTYSSNAIEQQVSVLS